VDHKQKFEEYLAENPGMYELFKAKVLDKVREGLTRISANGVLSELREEYAGKASINNTFATPLKYKLLAERPALKNFFECRGPAARGKNKEQTQRIINTLAQAARLGLGVAAETGRADAESAIRLALQAAARIMQQLKGQQLKRQIA